MGKALLAAIWMAAGVAVGVAAFAIYEVKRSPTPEAQPVAIDRLPSRQPHNSLTRWTITERFSAHNIIVAHVETEYLHEARAIAQQIVEPVKDRYAEILLYFHRPGRPDALPPRRVQWSPTSGYVETVYE